jgi:hypothetical protein
MGMFQLEGTLSHDDNSARELGLANSDRWMNERNWKGLVTYRKRVEREENP